MDGFDYSLAKESLLKAGINYRDPSDNNTERGKHLFLSSGQVFVRAEEEKTGPPAKKNTKKQDIKECNCNVSEAPL